MPNITNNEIIIRKKQNRRKQNRRKKIDESNMMTSAYIIYAYRISATYATSTLHFTDKMRLKSEMVEYMEDSHGKT